MHEREVITLSHSLSGRPSGRRRKRRRRRFVPSPLAKAVAFVSFWLFFVFLITRRSESPNFELYSSQAPQCHLISEEKDLSFTLVTQLSHDRIWMMKHHCQRFPHPMSIALWTNSTLKDTKDELVGLGCDLNLLQVQILDASSGAYDDYPVNQLRNLALQNVRTTHIIYIDVDFWTSEGLYEILTEEPSISEALIKNEKQALVIPAFQLFRQCRQWKDCREKNLPHMPYSRDDLAEMLKHKRGFIFDPTNKGGHGSTLYKEWMQQDPGTLLEIPCLQSNRYEPFLVVRYCQALPPFQEGFSGYGKNKMTWMMQMIRSGYSLSQIGGVYLVHYPHLDSASRQHWNQAPDQLVVSKENDKPQQLAQLRKPKASDNVNFEDFKRGQVDKLFVEFRKWLYKTVPDESKIHLCKDHQDDDSKLWVQRTSTQ